MVLGGVLEVVVAVLVAQESVVVVVVDLVVEVLRCRGGGSSSRSSRSSSSSSTFSCSSTYCYSYSCSYIVLLPLVFLLLLLLLQQRKLPQLLYCHTLTVLPFAAVSLSSPRLFSCSPSECQEVDSASEGSGTPYQALSQGIKIHIRGGPHDDKSRNNSEDDWDDVDGYDEDKCEDDVGVCNGDSCGGDCDEQLKSLRRRSEQLEKDYRTSE